MSVVTPPPDTDVLTVDEVAGLLRIERRTVYVCVRRHGLPAQRVGRLYRFSREAVLDWLRRGTVRSTTRKAG